MRVLQRSLRSMALAHAVAVSLAIAAQPDAFAAAGHDRSGEIMLAQSSMGAPDPGPPPAPYPTPRQDYAPYVPPARQDPTPTPEPQREAPRETTKDVTGDVLWGAIAFTADGSYSTIWKMASEPEAEASVAKKCAEYGRGGCKVVSFSGQQCVGLATFNGPYKRRRWSLSFTAGANTYPGAQRYALDRCNADERSQGRCQPRVAACADGR